MTRDRSEAAIERLLRDPASARTLPQGACLDAETLAAWADDRLTVDERAAAELHTSGCSRCQMLLAALVRTAPPAPERRAWWQGRAAWLIPVAAAIGVAVLAIRVLVPAVSPELQKPAAIAGGQPPASSPAGLAGPPPADADAAAPLPSAASVDTLQANGTALARKKETAAATPQRAAGTRRDELRQRELDDRAAATNDVASRPPAAAVAHAAPTAKTLAGAPPIEIVSSNPGSRWRIVGGGAVQRSMDGGSTWQLQQTGVSTMLAAGASPLPSVCWLVGPGGIVLLSTDGRSWRRVPFPEGADLVAVRATDAANATVTTSDGRTFTTTDGGRTWQLVKSEG